MPSSDKWPSETKMDGSDAHSTRLASRRRKKVSGAKHMRARTLAHVSGRALSTYLLAAQNKNPSAPRHSDDMSQTTRRAGPE